MLKRKKSCGGLQRITTIEASSPDSINETMGLVKLKKQLRSWRAQEAREVYSLSTESMCEAMGLVKRKNQLRSWRIREEPRIETLSEVH